MLWIFALLCIAIIRRFLFVRIQSYSIWNVIAYYDVTRTARNKHTDNSWVGRTDINQPLCILRNREISRSEKPNDERNILRRLCVEKKINVAAEISRGYSAPDQLVLHAGIIIFDDIRFREPNTKRIMPSGDIV